MCTGVEIPVVARGISTVWDFKLNVKKYILNTGLNQNNFASLYFLYNRFLNHLTAMEVSNCLYCNGTGHCHSACYVKKIIFRKMKQMGSSVHEEVFNSYRVPNEGLKKHATNCLYGIQKKLMVVSGGSLPPRTAIAFDGNIPP